MCVESGFCQSSSFDETSDKGGPQRSIIIENVIKVYYYYYLQPTTNDKITVGTIDPYFYIDVWSALGFIGMNFSAKNIIIMVAMVAMSCELGAGQLIVC